VPLERDKGAIRVKNNVLTASQGVMSGNTERKMPQNLEVRNKVYIFAA
jgi:hypothetical protein